MTGLSRSYRGACVRAWGVHVTAVICYATGSPSSGVSLGFRRGSGSLRARVPQLRRRAFPSLIVPMHPASVSRTLDQGTQRMRFVPDTCGGQLRWILTLGDDAELPAEDGAADPYLGREGWRRRRDASGPERDDGRCEDADPGDGRVRRGGADAFP